MEGPLEILGSHGEIEQLLGVTKSYQISSHPKTLHCFLVLLVSSPELLYGDQDFPRSTCLFLQSHMSTGLFFLGRREWKSKEGGRISPKHAVCVSDSITMKPVTLYNFMF